MKERISYEELEAKYIKLKKRVDKLLGISFVVDERAIKKYNEEREIRREYGQERDEDKR